MGIITVATSAVKCLTYHSLHMNVERVLCVSSEIRVDLHIDLCFLYFGA